MLRWAICGLFGSVIGCAPSGPPVSCADLKQDASASGVLPAVAHLEQGNDAGAQDEIGRELDDWHDAASRADEARYFSHFATEAFFLGTDATEHWDVTAFRAYAHPHFAQGKAWSFHAIRRTVVLAKNSRAAIAWFDEELATANLGPARGTGVVVRDGGRWKIAQYSLTITVPNGRFDAVKRVIADPKTPP